MRYEIKAFAFQNEGKFFEAKTGQELPGNYSGLVMVYPGKEYGQREAIFETHVENGERAWNCLHVMGQNEVEYVFV